MSSVDITYSSISNSNLGTALTELKNRGIGPQNIVSIFYAGSNYIIVYCLR